MSLMKNVSAACLLAALAGSASAQLVVDIDLGVLAPGAYSLSGPGGDGSPAGIGEAYNSANTLQLFRAYTTQEIVYQFTTTVEADFTLTNFLADVAADRDYTIASSLATEFQALDTGTWNVAIDGLAWVDGDFGVPTETFAGPFPAGTYYLILDEFTGGDGSFVPGLGGAYDIELVIGEVVPPAEPTVFTDLGIIGNSGGSITLELCGSDFDTEMGVYNASGGLVANNDDSCGLASSITTGLPAGNYWAAVTGWNTTFGNGWVASGSGRDFGNFAGSFGTAGVSGVVDPDEVEWFRFEIEAGTVTPPPAIDLGDVASVGDTFAIDSFGSTFDTELGLWDSNGALLANNDDAGGTLQSELPNLNLAEGTYYFSISAFNTTFGPLFGATTTSTTTGQASGFVNSTFWDTSIAAGQIQFYSFNVTDGAAPCVGDIADIFGGLGGDGEVEFGDFLALLGLIGPCPGGTPGCTGDIADIFGGIGGDGEVEFGDFLALLGLIGPCP